MMGPTFPLECVWRNASTTLGCDDYYSEACHLIVSAAANDFPFNLYFNNLLREKYGAPGVTQVTDCHQIVGDGLYMVPLLPRC